ncbi:hypothetical protein HDU87_007037 [Geranomyces variabilis]|uniref:ACB domain-containing protein n=1 Tax=Geranomyces variabilis TaxID=109894 RepID=A0AAD5XN29_9FUNG|nr:hypothetical protein HDU87_007037 [Geranomyces variabilis]
MADDDDASLRLEERFSRALGVLQSLGPEELGMVPSNDEKLQFYGLYKQATVGSCATPRPSMWDVVGRSKWDAWNKVRSMSQPEAKEAYVDACAKFLQRFPDRPLAAEVIEYFELSRQGLAGTITDSDDEFSERDVDEVAVDMDEPVDVAGNRDASLAIEHKRFSQNNIHNPYSPPHAASLSPPPHQQFPSASSPPPLSPQPTHHHHHHHHTSSSSSGGRDAAAAVVASEASSSSSHLLDGLIERIRDLEAEVSVLQTDVATQQQMTTVRRNAAYNNGPQAVMTQVWRAAKLVLPTTLWNFACVLVAMLFFEEEEEEEKEEEEEEEEKEEEEGEVAAI